MHFGLIGNKILLIPPIEPKILLVYSSTYVTHVHFQKRRDKLPIFENRNRDSKILGLH